MTALDNRHSVAVAVKRKAQLAAVAFHHFFQKFRMRCAAVFVYHFAAIEAAIDIELCAGLSEHRRRHVVAAAVTAVKGNFKPMKVGHKQIFYVVCVKLSRAVKYAKLRALRLRSLPVPHKVGNLSLLFLAQLDSVTVENLKPVILGRIVTCGNHYAEIAPHFAGKISYGVGGQYADIDDVAAVVVHSLCKRPQKRLSGRAGIPAHNDNGRVPVRAAQCRSQKISRPAVKLRAVNSSDTVRSENIFHHDLRFRHNK